MNGPELLIPLVAIVGTFASIIIFVYMYFSSRNRERMALIEVGKDATIFNQKKNPNESTVLKYGIIGTMVGLGIFLASVINEMFSFTPGTIYFAMILLMGGLGMIIYYRLINRNVPSENDDSFDNIMDQDDPIL